MFAIRSNACIDVSSRMRTRTRTRTGKTTFLLSLKNFPSSRVEQHWHCTEWHVILSKWSIAWAITVFGKTLIISKYLLLIEAIKMKHFYRYLKNENLWCPPGMGSLTDTMTEAMMRTIVASNFERFSGDYIFCYRIVVTMLYFYTSPRARIQKSTWFFL